VSDRLGPVLVCLDKFRGSASASEACRWLAEGLRAGGTGRPVLERPVADGGEGTVAALVQAGFCSLPTSVRGPLGTTVEAHFALRAGRAVIEMAEASGLHLVPEDARAPLLASSYGTGELIRAALDHGCEDIVLAVGGSATTDGGAGMLQALGARLVGADGAEVGPGGAALAGVTRVELGSLDPRLAQTRFVLACDVDNPLLGPNGAATVFAPQKGATPAEVVVLEAALAHFATLLTGATGRARHRAPGAGAAGGMGLAAMAVLGASRQPGVDFLLAEIGLARELPRAALCLVGEGSLDEQSLRGKAPVGTAALARRAGVPVIAVAGRVALGPGQLAAAGIDRAISLVELAGDPARSMARTAELLHAVGRTIAAELERPARS
jgi:glycerate kinase